MSILDNLKQIQKIDRQNMAGFISDFFNQCLEAYQLAHKFKLPASYKKVENVVICGMGGSAIGGNLARNLDSKIPVIIVRNYRPPAFINNKTLVITVSYSGNTKETLSCFNQALKKKAKIIAITTSGKLARVAKKKKIPLIKFAYSSPPRAALGWLFTLILTILARLNFTAQKEAKIEKSIKLLQGLEKKFEPSIKTRNNPAKSLAMFIYKRLPLIIGSEHLAPVARRWKGQLAENSKNLAFFEKAPEIFHNTVVGLKFPTSIKNKLVILILESTSYHPSSKRVFQAFEKLLTKEKIKYRAIIASGQTSLVEILSLVLLGDWTSFYLAILNSVDPTPTKNIDWMKKQT